MQIILVFVAFIILVLRGLDGLGASKTIKRRLCSLWSQVFVFIQGV